MSRPVIVLGGGGHGRVVADLLRELGREVLGYTDPHGEAGPGPGGWVHLGDDRAVAVHPPEDVELAMGLGSVGPAERREEIFDRFRDRGYRFPALVHPTAAVSERARIEEGAQIMMGATVQTGARIGSNAIVNTASSVDHGCEVGAHAHIAPGAVLSGDVAVGRGALVGTGASVIQGTRIGSYALVGAGSSVVDDVDDGATVAGVPARETSP